MDEKKTIFTTINGNDYYEIPFFSNYNNLVKDLIKVKSIKIGDKQIYYIKQYKPKGDDIVFLPHLWNFWKDKLNSGTNSLTRKGELKVWHIEKASNTVTQLYSDTEKETMVNYNNEKPYLVHDGLMSEDTAVPSLVTDQDLIAVSFKWTIKDDDGKIDSDKDFDKNTFYGIYEFVEEDENNPNLININDLLDNKSEKEIEKILEGLTEEYSEENKLKKYKIDETTVIENIKLFAKPAFEIDVGEINIKPIQKKDINPEDPLTTSIQDDEDKTLYESLMEATNKTIELSSQSEEARDDIKDSFETAANAAIDSQKKVENEPFSTSNNITDSFKEAANTAIKSEPISLKKVEIESKPNSTSNNITDSLITAANTAIKSEPISTSNNITDSLMTVANVAIESQTKSVIESITPSSNVENSFKEAANKSIQSQKDSLIKAEDSLIKAEDSSKEAANELTVPQPTQSIKTYTIQFDATGNVKIVTEKVQPSGQSLSHEIEDQYFKGNHDKYIPSNEKTYTVTVKTDPITSKTNIEI